MFRAVDGEEVIRFEMPEPHFESRVKGLRQTEKVVEVKGIGITHERDRQHLPVVWYGDQVAAHEHRGCTLGKWAPQDQRSRSNYLELSIEHVMRVMPISRCYLCGTPLEKTGLSQDHVVPKTLRVRKQSKVRGFRYAGTLPTHRKCNNESVLKLTSARHLI